MLFPGYRGDWSASCNQNGLGSLSFLPNEWTAVAKYVFIEASLNEPHTRELVVKSLGALACIIGANFSRINAQAK